MAVDKRKQFRQPARAPRGASDVRKDAKPGSDKVFGMERADPHDPYVNKRGEKPFIDPYGHKGD